MKIRLRHMLAAAFIAIAVIPVLFLGAWVQRTAMTRELAAVSEKHLLLARNITAALDRYAMDVAATFGYLVEISSETVPPPVIDLAQQIGLHNFSIVGLDGRATFQLNVDDDFGSQFTIETLMLLRSQIGDGATVFSDVMADNEGRPTIYITRSIAPNRIAIGVLDLDYVRQVQKAIVFGRSGHSAIVDRSGNVIAHPRADWQLEMKNIAKVTPVARMMAGESGVTSFFAPAVSKDMITGYTTVPSTGWGVMVPQPLEELEERAGAVKQAALGLIIIGLVTAAIISWLLSGLLVRPLEAVIAAARDISRGNFDSRVPALPAGSPAEFRQLITSFNAMTDDIAALVNERKRAEEALEEAQRIAKIGNWRWSIPRDKLISCSAEYARIHGVGLDKINNLTKRQLDNFIHADDRARVEEEFRRFDEFGTDFKLEYRIIRPDGEVRHILEIGEAVMRDDGPSVEQVGTVQDITERKLAESMIQESEVRFRDYAKTSSDYFWEMDENLRFSYFSERFTEITGLATEKLLGKTREETGIPGIDPNLWAAHLTELETHQPIVDFIHSRSHTNGNIVWLSINGLPVFDDSGIFKGYRGTGKDITKRTQLEEQLRHSQRMEAIGQLTGGVAHDFNNLLAIMIGNAELLKESVGDDEEAKQSIEAIKAAVERGASLTNRLLAFSRKQILSPVTTDVTALVGGLLDMLHRTLGETIDLRVDGTPALWAATIDPHQFENALVNLALNARDAMPRGGTLTIKIANVTLDETYAEQHEEVTPGDYVEVSVSDTGTGIHPEVLEKVFDPFFTTKEVGKGSGLGLSMVYGFAKQSNGHITVYSEVRPRHDGETLSATL